MRINKYLSQQNICSRREAEKLIQEGKITVNGLVVTDLGRQIDPQLDRVEIKGNTSEKTTILFYKPRGISSSKVVSEGKNIFDIVPEFEHLNTAGRLDKASEGLIILSNDGVLTKVMTSADHLIPKEYLVTVRETIMPAQIKRLEEGVQLQDGMTLPAEVKKINSHVFSIVLKEGRKHQIRRMTDVVRLTITRLERIRIGNVTGDGLHEGRYRFLSSKEVQELRMWR